MGSGCKILARSQLDFHGQILSACIMVKITLEKIVSCLLRNKTSVAIEGQGQGQVWDILKSSATVMLEKIGCIKFLLIFFNSVFWASGIALIVMGAVSRSSYAQFESFTGGGLSQCAIVIIVVGVAITIISFLGCFGAWTDNRCLLGLFTAVLVIILIIEVAAGIVLYAFRSKVEGKIKKQAKKVIIEYNPNLRAMIDDIQDKFHCCGAENYTDWLSSPGWKKNNSVPDSCCRVEKEACGYNITAENIYHKGCVGSIKTFLQKKLVWIAAVCIGLGLVEISGAVLGCLVLREAVIKSGYEQK